MPEKEENMRLVARLTMLSLLISFNLSAQKREKNIDYVEKYKAIAIQEMHRVGIPASITLAQGILESGNGKSTLAVKGNNHFGIKCHKTWNGKVMFVDDDAKDECFRVYENAYSSYIDHSNFLVSRDRYASLFELNRKNYKGWAKGLKKAGYATAKDYADRLIDIIDRYNLSQYDDMKASDDLAIVEEPEKVEPVVKEPLEEVKIILRHENNIKYVLAEEGEMVGDLVKRLDVWTWELLKYNEIDKDYVFEEGETVFLQPKRKKARVKTYMVKEGDSLFSISQQFGIRQKSILMRNGLKSELEIRPGLELVLRGRKK